MSDKKIYCPNCSEWVTTIEVTLIGDVRRVLKELRDSFDLEIRFRGSEGEVKNIDNLIIIKKYGTYFFKEAKDKKDLVLSKMFLEDISGETLYVEDKYGTKLFVYYNPIKGLTLSGGDDTPSDREDLLENIATEFNTETYQV